MRISDRYIGRQIFSGTLLAILLLTLLLVLGNVFKEIRPLLVEIGAPLWVLGDFILSVLPVSLIFTIPWAFLSATLLVFGRLSSDNELNAFRCAGLSLSRLAVPVFVLGALLSALCLYLNLEVAPRAKHRVREITTRTLIQDPRALLRAGTDQTRIKNLRVNSTGSTGDVFHNLHIFVTDDPSGDLGAYVHADTAKTVVDHEKKQIRLRLTGAYSDGVDPDGKQFSLLSEELEWMVVDYSDDARRAPKPSALTNRQIDEYLALNPEMPESGRAKYIAEKTRRHTSSLACLAFAMIGVPLGIKARRRDTSSGLVVSLGVATAYFVTDSLLGDPADALWLLWLPNLACFLLGLVLFRRARRR